MAIAFESRARDQKKSTSQRLRLIRSTILLRCFFGPGLALFFCLSVWAQDPPILFEHSGPFEELNTHHSTSQDIDDLPTKRLDEIIAENIDDLIEGKGDYEGLGPEELRHFSIYISTKEAGSLVVQEAMLRAKEAGVKVFLFIQGIDALVRSKPGERVDFNLQFDGEMRGYRIKGGSNHGGRMIKALIDHGFEINPNPRDCRWGIYTPKVPDKRNNAPINHIKAVTIVDERSQSVVVIKPTESTFFGRMFRGILGRWMKPSNPNSSWQYVDPRMGGAPQSGATFLSTQNLIHEQNDRRLNRHWGYLHGDEVARIIASYHQRYFEAAAASYASGGGVSDFDPPPPLRIQFQDGTFIQFSFTNGGNYNPVDQAFELINASLILNEEGGFSLNPNFRITEVYGNHYLMSHDSLKEAFAHLFETAAAEGKPIRAWFRFAWQFIRPSGSGLVASLAGFPVAGNGGVMLPPLSAGARQHIDARVFSNRGKQMLGWRDARPLTANEVTDAENREGKKGAHVLHDKTTVIVVKEGRKKFAYIFRGSINPSDRASMNSEVSEVLKLPLDSELAQEIIRSIVDAPQNSPEDFATLDMIVMRDAISYFTGVVKAQISETKADSFSSALLANKYREAIVILDQIRSDAAENGGTPSISDKDYENRKLFLAYYLNWMSQNRNENRETMTPGYRKPLLQDTVWWLRWLEPMLDASGKRAKVSWDNFSPALSLIHAIFNKPDSVKTSSLLQNLIFALDLAYPDFFGSVQLRGDREISRAALIQVEINRFWDGLVRIFKLNEMPHENLPHFLQGERSVGVAGRTHPEYFSIEQVEEALSAIRFLNDPSASRDQFANAHAGMPSLVNPVPRCDLPLE